MEEREREREREREITVSRRDTRRIRQQRSAWDESARGGASRGRGWEYTCVTSASTRTRPVRETKASRATDYGRSLAYWQNTLQIFRFLPHPPPHPPVKRATKEQLNSRHVHKCTERIIELSLTRLVGPRHDARFRVPVGKPPPETSVHDNLQRLCDSSTGTVHHLSPLFANQHVTFRN